MAALTIGMPTYNDYNGVYFTLQSLRLYQDLRDTELLVVDNYGCPATKELVEGWVHGARYVLATEVRGTAAAKERVFREAQGEAGLFLGPHGFFSPGGGTVRDTHARDGCLQLHEGLLARLQPHVSGLRMGRGLHPRKDPTGGRAVPVPALVSVDASLRQARRYRVSSNRRRETKELPDRARRAGVGPHPRAGALLRDLAGRSRCRRRVGGAGGAATRSRTKGEDAWGGRR